MPNTESTKYVCIHGHFYQPPRENPWLEEVQREPSAAPYHDWNERINLECYRANTASRLVDSENHIVELRNNYQSMSFNFGPTLLRWLERHAHPVYEAILESDRESCKRFKGHGNAFAQVYNHIIMPLANRRDKVTQVRWGARDFEKRFGRRPEGMWLAETAVDRETLQVLAEEGIRFTVLSPFQAARWRFIGPQGPWQSVRGGTIPTGRAYRYDCGGGRFIHLFFYDQALAHGVAFENLLEHSSKLIERIDTNFSHRPMDRSEPWLVHSATDGESYGHHFKFGDMALAAAFREMEKDTGAQVVNYSAFLASFPVIAEVEIIENTAWSCSHGLGRWQDDCGCHVGGEPGWSQKWRRGLRDALNFLRDRLAIHYESEMGRLSPDPWKVRDDYVQVLLNPRQFKQEFIQQHAGTDLSEPERSRFFQLLEMQRCALAMFTSCGWFFNEISELEAVLVMRYAARAMQLAEETGATSPEPEFLKVLARAPSNVAEYGDGANVYMKKVKPEVVRKDRVVANYAFQSFAQSLQSSPKLFCFTVLPEQGKDLGSNPVPCRYGRLTVRDERTMERESFLYALLHFGGLDLRCSVKPFQDADEYDSILKALGQAVEEQNTVRLIHTLDETFGKAFYSLQDAFPDLRTSVALDVSREPMRIYTDIQHHLYQDYQPLMRSLRRWKIDLPSDLGVVTRRVLSDEANQLVQEIIKNEQRSSPRHPVDEENDFFYRAHMGRLRSVQEEAQDWGITLRTDMPSQSLGRAMLHLLSGLIETFRPANGARLLRLMEVCSLLRLRPEMWQMQTHYYTLVHKAMADKGLARKILSCEGFALRMDEFLECRFARFLTGAK